MSARSTIEHALRIYYLDSADPGAIAQHLLAQYDAERDAARKKSSPAGVDATPDFFQPGRTYLRFVGDRELYFRVTSISTDNPNRSDSLAGDGPVAHGWVRTERFATVWGPGGYTDFTGWRDVTEGGEGR